MAEGPLISIIVPFFNRINLVCRAIESVRLQSYKNWELILVNDGSTESDAPLVDALKSLDAVNYLRLARNAGPAEARNSGISHARGEFIAFLDSDDIWEADKLSIQLRRMLDSGWQFSHTSYRRFDTKRMSARIIRSGRRSYVYPWPAFRCLIATPTVMVARDALSCLRFRSDLRYGEDTFLWLALSRKMMLFGIDEPLTTVFTGDLTAANNGAIQLEALRRLGREGLQGLPLHRAAHRVYWALRFVQRRFLP